MNPQPKPLKRSTLKRRKKREKNLNIAIVRESVMAREDYGCRVSAMLSAFGFVLVHERPLELAHLDARGMGGNPDLSRDTTANTVSVVDRIHQGARSMHSGHIKIEAMTDQGANGPLAITFYEKLPTELVGQFHKD